MLLLSMVTQAQSYYKVDVIFKLMDGSDQYSSLTTLHSPTYESVNSEFVKYVKPYKIKPYSLTCIITKVQGKMPTGEDDKFKPNPAPRKPKFVRQPTQRKRHHKSRLKRDNDFNNGWGITADTSSQIAFNGSLSFMPKTETAQPLIVKTPLLKDDSIVTAHNTRYRPPQQFVWIDYPKDGYPFYTVRFAKSRVTFINDTTFTFVEKFK